MRKCFYSSCGKIMLFSQIVQYWWNSVTAKYNKGNSLVKTSYCFDVNRHELYSSATNQISQARTATHVFHIKFTISCHKSDNNLLCLSSLVNIVNVLHIFTEILYSESVSFVIKMARLRQQWGMSPGPRFNIKMTSYQYRKSHCGDKTVVWSSYLLIGISYTGKMTSLYWIRPRRLFLWLLQNWQVSAWGLNFSKAGLNLLEKVMTWKYFPQRWPFVKGIHRSPLDFFHKTIMRDIWYFRCC